MVIMHGERRGGGPRFTVVVAVIYPLDVKVTYWDFQVIAPEHSPGVAINRHIHV